MANFSLYISGQTELGDVAEFFQKRLIGEGETPIAFFDGVFYESHQERVGNIVYQDYLIFSDKALYLWARGASKDYLDRFTLGAVSVNSRNKDSAFATMNLKIRREGKEPVFVIFDMVEIREAETIIRLQTAIESTIEDYLGVNYRHEIPPDAASIILQAAQSVCPPQMLSLPHESPEARRAPVPDAGIGYGQDLLEQYRAMGDQPGQQAQPSQGVPKSGGMGVPPGIGASPFAATGGLEAMLPTDPASLKRVADQIRSMVGNAPFKLRDQVMKDLQHVPGDVATVLTALNELLANIAGNPMAERFVMNAIKTAVVNDGMIGSLGKIMKMTGLGGGGGKKSQQPVSPYQEGGDHASRPRKSPFEEESEDGSPTIRRKKISVQDDPDNPASAPFAGNDEPITSRGERKPAAPPEESVTPRGRRKKLSVKMEGDNEIARKLMSYDESERDDPAPEPHEPASAASASLPVGVRKKKLSIRTDEGSDAEADIVSKLKSYDEEERGAITTPSSVVEPEVEASSEPEPERPVRKKVQIVAAVEPDVKDKPDAEAVSEQETPVKRKVQVVASEEPAVRGGAEVAAKPEPETEPEAPARKKVLIVESDAEPASGAPVSEETVATPTPEPEAKPEPESVEPLAVKPESDIEEIAISEEVLIAALGEESESEERSDVPEEYMTMESDDPSRKVSNVKPSEQQRHSPGKSGRSKRRGKKF
ncbi:MAG TPA: hypothetical protein ENL07_05540 [Chlorobaculum parvum]|uniref:Uncharacterized protein n=1 Tax=Chlorobaculum parvum TaxID=274539 RepID=A0A7C5DGM7_9CHLB|nr:hypothetical protein [Chlorobaculum parvum]